MHRRIICRSLCVGCGKTILAREIAKALHARPPKIVSAPELLDRWVGSSEKLVRALFEDAEMELKAVGGDASKSMLHVVVQCFGREPPRKTRARLLGRV